MKPDKGVGQTQLQLAASGVAVWVTQRREKWLISLPRAGEPRNKHGADEHEDEDRYDGGVPNA